MNIYIGLMSGTSMDGIDAALIDLDNHQLLHAITVPYEPMLKKDIYNLINNTQVSIAYLTQTNQKVGEAFANAALELIQQSDIASQEIKAIGSHGQTIVHAPNAQPAYTLQIGCGHTIAAHTGITTVADFRTRDLVLGGQGAPIAPLYHRELFKNLAMPYAVLNIGGISNLSCFLDQNNFVGYDVGPGNQLLDAWISRCLGCPYDKNGTWSSTGQPIPRLIEAVMQDNYFKENYPKSLDKSYFSLEKILPLLTNDMKKEDVQASLAAITVNSIVETISMWPTIRYLLVCGGGVHNQVVMKNLQKQLSSIQVLSTIEHGINPDFIEAMMCAWLAQQCLLRNALPMNAVTGGETTILGSVFYN